MQFQSSIAAPQVGMCVSAVWACRLPDSKQKKLVLWNIPNKASKKNLFCRIFPTKQAKKTCFAEYSQQSR